MNYTKNLLLLFFLIVTIIFVVQVNGQEQKELAEDEYIEHILDGDGKVIGTKIVKKGEDSLSEDESTFTPGPVNEEENEDEEDNEDNGFLGHYITVRMGNFLDHPYEDEGYLLTEDEPAAAAPEEEKEVNSEGEKKEEIKEEVKEEKVEKEDEKKEEEGKEEEKVEKEDEKKEEEVKEEKAEDNKEEVGEQGDNEVEEKAEDNKEEVGEQGDNEVEEKAEENKEEVGEQGDNEVEEKAEEDNKGVEENVVEVEIVMDETVIINKSKNMEEFFNKNEKLVIGCFESFGNEEYLNFKNASNAVIIDPKSASDNYFNGEVLKFVNINDNNCRNTVKRLTDISMYKNDVVYCIHKRCYQYSTNDLMDIQKLKLFLREYDLPLISEYDPEKKDEYKKWNIPVLVYFYDDKDKFLKDIKFLSEIAEEHRNDFFIFAATKETFNMDALDEPLKNNVLFYAPHFQALYSIQEILEEGDVIDKVAIEAFLYQYSLGNLTPKIVQQDFDKDWVYENFVVKSVPRYYYPHVLNPERDSIVIYYKTDCPYSQEFLKTFEKLGRKYVNFRNRFSVIKYEAEEQKIPKMSLWRKLEGYPTVVLYQASPFTRKKKYFYIYPEDAGRSAINVDRWIQLYSFYKPKAIFNDEDYKDKEILDANSEELDIDEEKEERINQYLEDPNLIFTRFGYGKEIQMVKDEENDSGEEEAEYFYDNTRSDTVIPMTGTYYQLTASTYVVKTSEYTPPPSIYDDDDEENKEKNK